MTGTRHNGPKTILSMSKRGSTIPRSSRGLGIAARLTARFYDPRNVIFYLQRVGRARCSFSLSKTTELLDSLLLRSRLIVLHSSECSLGQRLGVERCTLNDPSTLATSLERNFKSIESLSRFLKECRDSSSHSSDNTRLRIIILSTYYEYLGILRDIPERPKMIENNKNHLNDVIQRKAYSTRCSRALVYSVHPTW